MCSYRPRVDRCVAVVEIAASVVAAVVADFELSNFSILPRMGSLLVVPMELMMLMMLMESTAPQLARRSQQ